MDFQITSLVIIGGFLLVGLVSMLNSRKYASGSLIRLERRFSFLNFIGGGLFGIAIYYLLDGNLFSPEVVSSSAFLSFVGGLHPFTLASLYLIVGILFFFLSKRGLEEQITNPVEQFSQAMSIYGSKGIFIRLLELGALEFRLFARKFNEATLNIANDLDIVKEYFDEVIENLNEVNHQINSFNKETVNFKSYLQNFTNMVKSQEKIVTYLESMKMDAKNWFENSGNKISEISNELLVLSESLNLMTINIAIEAANSGVEQFHEIATKSREIFQTFEKLTIELIREIGVLKSLMTNHFQNIESITSSSGEGETSIQILDTVKNIIELLEMQMTKRLAVRSEIERIDRTLLKIHETLPKGY